MRIQLHAERCKLHYEFYSIVKHGNIELMYLYEGADVRQHANDVTVCKPVAGITGNTFLHLFIYFL